MSRIDNETVTAPTGAEVPRSRKIRALRRIQFRYASRP
jgi:hypothetical protein